MRLVRTRSFPVASKRVRKDVRVWSQQLVSILGVVSGYPPGKLSRIAEEGTTKDEFTQSARTSFFAGTSHRQAVWDVQLFIEMKRGHYVS